MKSVIVLQHAPHEILGTLNPLLKAARIRIRYVNFSRDKDAHPNLEKYEGLVILGGYMNVDEEHLYPHLKKEIELIQKAIELDIPVLGICLGAQLIAKALGAHVGRNNA